MAWQVLAESGEFETLVNGMTVENMEIPKGTRVRIEMDLVIPVGSAFNLPGAEYIFLPVLPEGLDLIDVHGEGSKAWVECVADPPWLIPLLTSLKFWAGVSLLAIGITISLGLLAGWITCEADLPTIGDVKDIAKIAVIGILGVLAIRAVDVYSKARTPPPRAPAEVTL